MSDETAKPAEEGAQASVREDFDRRYLWLATVPIGIYLLFYFVLGLTRNTGISFEVVGSAEFEGVAFAETKYRYLWISAFWVSCVVSLAVIVSAFLTLFRETPQRHRAFVVWLVVVFTLAVTAYENGQVLGSGVPWYEDMGAGLYKTTLGQMPVSIGQPFEPVAYEDSVLRMLDVGFALVKFFGTIALVIIGMGSILTLTHLVAAKEGASAPSVESRARHLSRNVALLKAYLYQGAVVFVFAVLAMISWMLWPLGFLKGDEAQGQYRDLLVGAAILRGVGYTIGVASLYLPPAVLLRQRVKRLARQALVGAEDDNVEAWLQKRGLHFQPLDELRQLAAVLLPAFVSAAPLLLNF